MKFSQAAAEGFCGKQPLCPCWGRRLPLMALGVLLLTEPGWLLVVPWPLASTAGWAILVHAHYPENVVLGRMESRGVLIRTDRTRNTVKYFLMRPSYSFFFSSKDIFPVSIHPQKVHEFVTKSLCTDIQLSYSWQFVSWHRLQTVSKPFFLSAIWYVICKRSKVSLVLLKRITKPLHFESSWSLPVRS